jgi:hypothetical protein
LKERFGTKVPETEQFSVILRDLTKADTLKVKKVAETIRNLYLDGVPYIKSSEEGEKEDSDMTNESGTGQFDSSKAKPPEGLEQLTLGANIKIWLPKDDQEAAKKAIRLIKLYSGINDKDS